MQSIGDGQAQASAPVVAGLPATNNASLHLAPSPTSRLSWTGGGGSSVASGGLSNLEYGSDGTYADSGVGTLQKGTDNGLEIEMKALAIEEESAIIAAVSDRGENLLQDQRTLLTFTRNGGGEEAGMDLHIQSSTQEEELVQSFEGRKPSSSALVICCTYYLEFLCCFSPSLFSKHMVGVIQDCVLMCGFAISRLHCIQSMKVTPIQNFQQSKEGTRLIWQG